ERPRNRQRRGAGRDRTSTADASREGREDSLGERRLLFQSTLLRSMARNSTKGRRHVPAGGWSLSPRGREGAVWVGNREVHGRVRVCAESYLRHNDDCAITKWLRTQTYGSVPMSRGLGPYFGTPQRGVSG